MKYWKISILRTTGTAGFNISLLAGLGLAASAIPLPGVADDSVRMEEITVKGEALDAAEGAFTVNVIDAEAIRGQRVEQPLRLIEKVPGVDLGAFRQGGVADAFTIRGFTGGGHGSDAGVSLDGITLNQGESHADGYADTNIIIPLELESLAVHKGPVSALHGNFARGGVLDFRTRKGGEYQDVDVSAGSFSTFDAQAATGGSFGGLDTNFAIQAFDTAGWRENARYTKATASGRFAYDVSDRLEIALSLRAHSGQWEAPGYIPESQFEDEDRRDEQAINAEDDGGSKRFFAERVDVNYLLSDRLKLLLFAYGTQNEFIRFAKFGYAPGGQTERFYDRDVAAVGGSLNGAHRLAGVPFNWVAGVEYYAEETEWKRWNTSDRVRIAQTEDRLFTIDTLSLYSQFNWDISPALRPVLGLRYDTFSGDFDNNDPGVEPTRQDLDDYGHVSPKLGVRSTVANGIELRASAANGFALPDGEAKYDDALDVDTVEYWQYEVGTTITASPAWFVDAAYFIVDSSDEILEDPLGSGEFRNVGETQRSGLEAEVHYYTPVDYLELRLTAAIFDSEIRSNPDASLEGNEITGLPDSIATVSVEYAPPTGWGGRISWRQIGEYYLTDDNTESYEGYDLVNAGVFYKARVDGGRTLHWYLDVNNVTDEEYAEAVWFGSATSNFAPAPPLNVTMGLALNY